jgi:hypothetical protein
MIFVICIVAALVGGFLAHYKKRNVILWAVCSGGFPFAVMLLSGTVMGSFSIYHLLIIGFLVAIPVVLGRRMTANPNRPRVANGAPQHVSVGSKAELLGTVQTYAAQGYQTVMDRGHLIVMSKKVPFNWLLCIVLLFIPIIGWIALLVLLFGNKNKVSSITIEAPENA